MKNEYFEDDRPVVIPDHIKNKTREELDEEIAEMEAVARKERDRLRRERTSETA